MSQEQRAAARSMMSKGDLAQTPDQERADFDVVFADRPLGDDVKLIERTLGGVPALSVEVEGADRDGVILYLHGGGYVVGSARTGANLATPLSRRSRVPAVSLEYRRAPEHPFPAAIDDALAAYKELLGSGRPIVLVGDSAGGGLVLATLLAARREGLPLPVAAIVFSPWVDLTLSGESMDTRGDFDPLFSRAHMARYADQYLGGHESRDALASPVFADLTGLPPLLIQVGSAEVLLDDALRLAVRAAHHDVDVSLDVVAGAPHVYPLMAGVMDESDDALDRAAQFLSLHLPADQKSQ